MAQDDVALAQLDFWPTGVVACLERAWVKTADQVIGVASTQNGIESLAAQCGVETEIMRKLVQRTIDARGAAGAAFNRRVDTAQQPLGARKPDDQ